MKLLRLLSPRKWASEGTKPRVQQKPIWREGRRFRPCLEVLEDRTLFAAYMVTLATDANANGGGQQDNANANAGDLRWCLTQADKAAGNTITFANQVNNQTIDLQAVLPDVNQSMTIAPAAGVTVTVERPNNAKTNFRIFTIDTNCIVTLGAFTIQGGYLVGGNQGQNNGAGIYNQGTLTLKGTTVQKNTSDSSGGGIYNTSNLTLVGASISNNEASSGGGIYNTGTVTTAAGAPVSTLSTNQANSGAAIYNAIDGNISVSKLKIKNNIAQSNGGGIYNEALARLNIQNSTFSNNQAIGGSGGGIYNNGTGTIDQNTFTNNSAGMQGGAIKNFGNVTQAVNNTINGNKVTGIPGQLAANETGGGISNAAGATFELVNSIVAGNTAPTDNDVDGTFDDLGNNFIGDGTGGNFYNGSNGDQVGTTMYPLAPLLGPLQDNGGGIETELPMQGSPVIDCGNNSYAISATDERGYVRIINGIIDLGAVEYDSVPAQTATATVTVSSSANPSILNQLVTFTAAVSGNNGMPTGSVTFIDGNGNMLLGTSTLDNNGDASISTSGLVLDAQTIVAIYSGDDVYFGASGTLVQTVQQGTAGMTLMPSSGDYVSPGQAVTFSVDVMSAGGSEPTGTVTFLDGTTTLGTAGLNATGNASFTTSSLSTGVHVITAVYGGDETYAATSAFLMQTVGFSFLSTPTVSVSSSASAPIVGQSVTFTAKVSGGNGSPTGSVTFLDGTTVLGSGTVDDNGNATFSTTALALGAHNIIAIYSGDATNSGSEASMTQIVVLASSTTTLSSSANPSPQGQSVTFTATVAATDPNAPAPTGTVAFYDGTTLLGTGILTLVNGQWQATFTTADLEPGMHHIVAIYSGDNTFASSADALDETITS